MECMCPLLDFLNDNPIDKIKFLPSYENHRNHIHPVKIMYKNGNRLKAIFKTTKSKQEVLILELLNFLFQGNVKRPHIRMIDKMERLENQCTTIILEQGPMSVHSLLEQVRCFALSNHILYSIVEKVNLLHQNEIAHLDLCIDNILFENNEAFLIDFEFSALLPSDSLFHFTSNLPLFGKYNYMSKERKQKLSWNGFQEDIYAIGIIACLLFFDCFPYNNDDNLDFTILEKKAQKYARYSFRCSDDIEQVLQFIKLTTSDHRPYHASKLLSHPIFAKLK